MALIVASGPYPSPFTYELSAAQDLIPQAVSAVFDCSGAGGPVRPCLSFYAQSGELLGRTFPDTILQPGDVAEITYAPFLRGAQAVASGGDYVFVQEVGPSSSGTSFVFNAIPQDARHLVVVMNALLANSRMVFNGDTAAHYHTLNNRLRDVGGVLTYVQSISAVTNGIDLVALNGASELGQAIIEIPYYRHGGNFSRAARVNGTMQPSNAAPNDWNNTQSYGWWSVQNSLRPAITSINIAALSGVGGVASLYKIL